MWVCCILLHCMMVDVVVCLVHRMATFQDMIYVPQHSTTCHPLISHALSIML